jgi:hypothetical protein
MLPEVVLPAMLNMERNLEEQMCIELQMTKTKLF